ncbi:MAG: Biopolymer transport protein ExbD/TolR [Bryobacterales bacterium]|jgi:biopolymer transport protein ExbD|nr:Biopolymer transport protein ExbD/TolR [Bryobacterales bacterium]
MEQKKAPPPVSDINVTPMVDVMLVVLIIFMVITPMLSKTVPIDMARARNPITMADADKEDAVMVAVTRDGKAFLSPGSVLIAPEQLTEKVKDLLTNKPTKLVYVKADARARYGVVEDVVDFLRGAGVDQVGLLTEEIKSKKSGAAPAGAGL